MNSIHIKLEYEEALSLKKDALILEKELLETLVHIKAYNELRKKEFLVKSQLKKDLSYLEEHMQTIKQMLPIEELGIIQKDMKQVVKQVIRKSPQVIEKRQSDVERELADIRQKLARLG